MNVLEATEMNFFKREINEEFCGNQSLGPIL